MEVGKAARSTATGKIVENVAPFRAKYVPPVGGQDFPLILSAGVVA